jgi:hypothetical protein
LPSDPSLPCGNAGEPSVAHAQDAGEFYRGRTVSLVVGFNPGGGAGTYARLVARHLGKQIAGNPTVVVRNMQGAGSVVAANHIYNVSPKDGTELGLFAGNITIDPLMGGTQHKYDARKFGWVGAPSSDSNVCLSSLSSSFKTIDDVIRREMITGTSGTSTYDFPVVMNNVIGTKFKLVKGYGGSAALRSPWSAARSRASAASAITRCGPRVSQTERPTSWCRSDSPKIRTCRTFPSSSTMRSRTRIARSCGWYSAGSTSSARSARRPACRRSACVRYAKASTAP